MQNNQESRTRRHVGSRCLLPVCAAVLWAVPMHDIDRAPRLHPTTVHIQFHAPCERMRVQRQALAVIATLGSPGLLRTQALRPHQFLLRSPSAAAIGRFFGTSRTHSSCAMSSSQPCASDRGPIILGSKSFTRKMIIEEMGFTPITR